MAVSPLQGSLEEFWIKRYLNVRYIKFI
jgi:hypothetical protein